MYQNSLNDKLDLYDSVIYLVNLINNLLEREPGQIPFCFFPLSPLLPLLSKSQFQDSVSLELAQKIWFCILVLGSTHVKDVRCFLL